MSVGDVEIGLFFFRCSLLARVAAQVVGAVEVGDLEVLKLC